MTDKEKAPRKVLIRIKRMGSHWASCGVPIFPPAHLLNQPGIVDRCAKLVPGQVVELPEDHDLVWHPVVERVRGPEKDEFIRPWVFNTTEDAKMADPSLSLLSSDQIMQGLSMIEGATRKQVAELERRKAMDTGPYDPYEDDPDNEDEGANLADDENAKRSQNRQAPDVYEDAQEIQGDTPVERRTRRRPRLTQ